MKNKIFKVCTLGIIALTLFTGCQYKEGEVTKIKKNEGINLNDTEIDLDYTLEVFRFIDKKSAREQYEHELLNIKNKSSKVEIINESDDIFEVIEKVEKEDNVIDSEHDAYFYKLYIQKDDAYLLLHECSSNPNKDKMKEVGSTIKDRLTKEKDLVELFEKYAKENNYPIDDKYYDRETLDSMNCYEAYLTTNSPVNSSNKESKVVAVEIENIDLKNEEKFQVSVVGKDKDNQIVWSVDYGTVPLGTELIFFVDYKPQYKYAYTIWDSTVIARDVQTGSIIWKSELDDSVTDCYVLNSNEKVILFTGMGMGFKYEILDNSNGKTLKSIEIEKYLVKEDKRFDFEEYYNIDSSTIKQENENTISIDVHDKDDYGNDTGLVGYLKINTDDYSVKFEKTK